MVKSMKKVVTWKQWLHIKFKAVYFKIYRYNLLVQIIYHFRVKYLVLQYAAVLTFISILLFKSTEFYLCDEYYHE